MMIKKKGQKCTNASKLMRVKKKKQELEKYKDNRYIFIFLFFSQKKLNRILNLDKKTKNLIYLICILKNYF